MIDLLMTPFLTTENELDFSKQIWAKIEIRTKT